MNSCIYDRYVQCFHECDGCPNSDKSEPDWDMLYEQYLEEKLMNEQ